MLHDIVIRVHTGDMENLVRQMVITIALFFVNIKKEMKSIFEHINADYKMFNQLPEEYQLIVAETIAKTQKLETIWTVMLGSAAASFPILALVMTVYSQFTDEPRLYMVHETILPFIDHKKYTSPYFEIIAVYSLHILRHLMDDPDIEVIKRKIETIVKEQCEVYR
ncbi:unnamed protein product [Leptidea sinapis]|uniref:Uncharacterized protein n=1 Tax=Leptidea sinapis TaxID=189913 RepID=A0A5E4QP59_9NEOP|nr:unnamed protein product [Leptidea sinapis]